MLHIYDNHSLCKHLFSFRSSAVSDVFSCEFNPGGDLLAASLANGSVVVCLISILYVI